MNRKTLLTLMLLPLLASQAFAARKPASNESEVALLDSALIDKAGNFRYSYTVPGGCAKHTGRVELELKVDEGRSMMYFVSGARIKIIDSAPADACISSQSTRVEGVVNLQELLQQTADRQGAMILERRIPISLPETSVFTGK